MLSLWAFSGEYPKTEKSPLKNSNNNFYRFFVGGTAKFFGVEVETLASSEQCWWERRRRLAIKRFGGVKDEFLDGGGNAYNSQVCE